MERKFDDIDIALYHLIFIGNIIERTFKAFSNVIGRVDNDTELVFYVNTSSMIVLQADAFLEEYHQYLRSDKSEMMATIENIKRAVKPSLKLINQWKERKEFRNNVLAHNLRNGGKSVFERGLSSFDVPKEGADLHVLVSCIGMIKDVFQSAFQERIAAVQKVLDESSEAKAPRRYDRNTFEAAIESVRLEINENIKKLHRGEL
jgi:hypothetical protein